MNTKRWIAIGFAVLSVIILGAIVGSGYGFARIPEEHMKNPTVVLPILLLVGTLALLTSLAFIATAFAALDLSDANRALSLPEGSVRSLIALLLLVLFAITSIFLYRELRFPATYVSTGLTQEDKDKLVEAIPSKDLLLITSETITSTVTSETITSTVASETDEVVEEVVYTVTRRVESEASKDFAEQMLTTLATLVAAVAAFYFGTKAVETGARAAAEARPTEQVVVPDVIGLGVGEAERKVEARSLIPEAKDVVNPQEEAEKVFHQSPEADTEVEKGSTVVFFVARAPEEPEEPEKPEEPEEPEEPTE